MKSFRAFNESDARQLAMDSLHETTELMSSALDFLAEPERWTPENNQLDSLVGRKFETNTLISQRKILKELYLETLPAHELASLTRSKAKAVAPPRNTAAANTR